MSLLCLSFVFQEDDPNCYLQWNDSYVSSERVAELKPYQRINHFPGMGEICRFALLLLLFVVVVEALPKNESFSGNVRNLQICVVVNVVVLFLFLLSYQRINHFAGMGDSFHSGS